MGHMILEMHVEPTVDYFRVANAIQEIEASKNKDIEKIKILHKESSRLFQELQVSHEPRIKALKWNGTQYIVKDMSEKELLKEIEQSTEREHREQSQINLTKLALHYKKMWSHGKIYIPYFEFSQQLLKRVVGNPRISEIYDDTLRSKDLVKQLVELENKFLKVNDELIDYKKKIHYLKADMKDTLFNEQIFLAMGKIYKENIRDEKLIRMLILVQVQKTTTIKKIFKELQLTPVDIRNILQEYPQFFTVKGESISINTETLEAEGIDKAEAKLDRIEEVEKSSNRIATMVSGIFSKVKGLKK